MKLFILFFGSCLFLFTGCMQFRENVEADEMARTPQGLNELQENQVSEFAEAGQLNATEEREMDESISGN